MSVKDLKSCHGSVESLQECPPASKKGRSKDNKTKDDGGNLGRVFWPAPFKKNHHHDVRRSTNNHPFVIKVEEAVVHSPPPLPTIKPMVLEDITQVECVSDSPKMFQKQKSKGKKKKAKSASNPFSLFYFYRKADKSKTFDDTGTAPPSSPTSGVIHNNALNSDLNFFQHVSRPMVRRNGELPSLNILSNAPTLPPIHNHDEPLEQEYKEINSIYDIYNAQEKALGDFTSVNFDIESYKSDEEVSPNSDQILPVFGSRPTTKDGWSSAKGRRSTLRSITAGIRPALPVPRLEEDFPVPEVLPELQPEDLENWMSSLSPDLQMIPLNHLFIPGSHDAFSFSLAPEEEIGPDAPDVVANLDSCCPCMARPAILRWSVTQKASVGEQLKHGIRYFDIRVAARDSRFFFVHGLYGDDLEPLLSEISHFLVRHPGEVVLLDFQHFHGLGSHDHAALITLLKATFADLLCPFFQQLKHLTLAYLAKYKYQVLVFYRHTQTMQAVSWLWSSDSIPNPWPDTTSTTKMIKFLEDKLQKRDPKTFFVTQCILTPSGKYLLSNFTGMLEKNMAAPCNKVVGAWVGHLPSGPQGPNIVMTDFVEHDDWAVPRAVIRQNSMPEITPSPLKRY